MQLTFMISKRKLSKDGKLLHVTKFNDTIFGFVYCIFAEYVIFDLILYEIQPNLSTLTH